MAEHEEVEEHIHHAHEPFDKTVAASMAIIAALLAVVSVLGQHYNTEELLNQGKASDQWAYYQAKDIRRFMAEATRDSVSELKSGAASVNKYDQAAKKYHSDAEAIQEKAREFEKERDRSGDKATRFHRGEIFLEVAIVLCSLSILTKLRPLYIAGVVSALVGIGISLTGWWA
jgi:DNA repair ATPase RecN